MMPPRQPVPSLVAPPAPVSPSASVSAPAPAPFTADHVSAWKKRLSASKDPIKRIIDAGKKRTRKYEGKALGEMPLYDTVVVPIDYSYVEQKKSQLFFQVPELQLEARRADSEAAAPIAAAVINEALGPYGVNAKAMMFECLTDALCPTGYAVSVIGYDPTINGEKDVKIGEAPAPVTQPGAVLGLNPPTLMQDITEPVENVIAETYFWDRLPPGFLRAPSEFRGSNFDKAAWIGYRFSVDEKDDGAQRTRGTSKGDDDDYLLSPIPTEARAPKRWGTRVYYKASLFDADAKHPDLIRTFVLFDDQETATDHKNSPYQRWSPTGTMIGMVGYPVHILTLRYLPDSCFPPSDVQMSEQQVEELGKGRTQMVQRRDRAMPQVGYDATRVLPDSLAKIQRNENTGFVGFNGPISDDMIKGIDKGTYGRENFEFDRVIKNDIDQIWALGANAGVMRAEGNETATKATQIQSAVDTRLEAERTRVLEFFVTGAMKLFALKQLFSTNEDYVRVVGPDGTARLMAWTNQSIPGQYAFKAKPDSHIRIDAAQDREQKIRGYNLLRQDPMINPEVVIKPVAEMMGYDMARLIKQPDPKQPEPATGSISLTPADFIGPQAPAAQIMARSIGIEVPDNVLAEMSVFGQLHAQMMAEQKAIADQQKAAAKGQAGSTDHPGAAPKPEPIDKHDADITGQRSGPRVM